MSKQLLQYGNGDKHLRSDLAKWGNSVGPRPRPFVWLGRGAQFANGLHPVYLPIRLARPKQLTSWRAGAAARIGESRVQPAAQVRPGQVAEWVAAGKVRRLPSKTDAGSSARR